MRYKAMFIDFYGTIVDGDTAVIRSICSKIAATSRLQRDASFIMEAWGNSFTDLCKVCHGESFRTQRLVEQASLRQVLDDCQSDLDAETLCAELYAYWKSRAIFDGVKDAIARIAVPVCIVSNIDTADIVEAGRFCGIDLGCVITSEMCRSYKPRPEPFLAAIDRLGCEARTAVHIGDSYRSDVVGAKTVGLSSVWVSPNQRKLSRASGLVPDAIASTLLEAIEHAINAD